MPDVSITDELDKPIATVKVDLAHPSSLVQYLKTELLHLAVIPDFLARKDELLTEAATKPLTFQARASHAFALGTTSPEITITPALQAAVHVNASPGTNLFTDDPFHRTATVPPQTGYIGVSFEGSLTLGASAKAGDLSFGFTDTTTIDLTYYKAFPLGPGEPTLLDALTQTMAGFVIPADLSDLGALQRNDCATVSGTGILKISGGVSITAAPNPLASVDLRLGAGTLSVKTGVTTGLTASLTITGSYQVRVQLTGPRQIILSFLQQQGTTLKADWATSAGITAKLGDTDLLPVIIDAISTDPTKDQTLLNDLTTAERKALTDAITAGLNHSLQASIDAVLTRLTENDAAFQYSVHLDQLTPEGTAAVHRALDGDLSGLTALEETMAEDGTLAPGITLLNSVLTEANKQGFTLNLNLLGIINFTSLVEFLKNSEILTDAATGNVTIKDTTSGTRISAIANPLDRAEALRKALFDSVLVTSTYRAGRAIAAPELASEHVHFAFNQNTNHPIMRDYLTWFVTLNLLTTADREELVTGFVDGGPSSCILRTAFNDHDCTTMFLVGDQARPPRTYEDLGRQALRALLDSAHSAVDGLRDRLLDDALWERALAIGANVNLAPLVGIDRDDPRVNVLIGDVFIISQWADAMSAVGALVLDLRQFVGVQDPAVLLENNAFKQKRNALQAKLSAVVRASRMRFDEPWGMVSLFWAAGSPQTAYAKTTTAHLTVERGRTAPANRRVKHA